MREREREGDDRMAELGFCIIQKIIIKYSLKRRFLFLFHGDYFVMMRRKMLTCRDISGLSCVGFLLFFKWLISKFQS